MGEFMSKRSTSSDLEHQHQASLVDWVKKHETVWPELRLLFAVPNAAKRSPRLAAYMKAEGLKAGVPDLMLPVARQGYHGLFIEMKRPKKYSVSDEQKQWIADLQAQGYKAVVCAGFDAAWGVLRDYVGSE